MAGASSVPHSTSSTLAGCRRVLPPRGRQPCSLHTAAQAWAEKPWAPLDERSGRIVAQNMVRRMLSLVRNAHHGGTLIYLPAERAAEFCGQNPYRPNPTFADEEPRQRIRTLTVRLMNALAEAYGQYECGEQTVGWNEYMTGRDPTVLHLTKPSSRWRT